MDGTPRPQFFSLDSAPTPSDDWLLEQLLNKRNNSQRKSAKLRKALTLSLKDGTHQFCFWTSSADNQLNNPPLSYAKIYLTIDNVVYPFMWICSATTVNLANFNRILDCPLGQFADTFATVVSNMQWTSSRCSYGGSFVSPPDYVDYMGYYGTIEYKHRIWLTGESPRFGEILSYPIKWYLDLVGKSANVNSIQQMYLDACENQIKDVDAQNNMSNNLVDENRITQGWKLAFYGKIAFSCPANFDVQEELTQRLWSAGRRDVIAVFHSQKSQLYSAGNLPFVPSTESAVSWQNDLGNRDLIVFLDMYQTYIYSSIDKFSDQIESLGLTTMRQQAIIDNPYDRNEILRVCGLIGSDKLFGKPITVFKITDALHRRGFTFVNFDDMQTYLRGMGQAPLIQQTFRNMPVDSSSGNNPSHEQQNDPSRYGSGTQAFDFSGGN